MVVINSYVANFCSWFSSFRQQLIIFHQLVLIIIQTHISPGELCILSLQFSCSSVYVVMYMASISKQGPLSSNRIIRLTVPLHFIQMSFLSLLQQATIGASFPHHFVVYFLTEGRRLRYCSFRSNQLPFISASVTVFPGKIGYRKLLLASLILDHKPSLFVKELNEEL